MKGDCFIFKMNPEVFEALVDLVIGFWFCMMILWLLITNH